MIRRLLTIKALVALAPLLLALLVAGMLGMAVIGSNAGNLSGGCASKGPSISLGSGSFRLPLNAGTYTITSGYGPRTNPPGFHAGVDFAAPLGTPIYAAVDGTVAAAGPASGFGTWVVIDSTLPDGSGFSTVYGHMPPASLQVKAGDVVSAGQPIAAVGAEGQATGPHLHFEVWPGTRLGGGHSTDPIPWLQANLGSTPHGAPPPATPPPPAHPGGLLGPVPPQGPQTFFTPAPDAEQNSIAATVVGVVKGRGLPLRAAVIDLATGAQESGDHNLNYGDRDSLGYLQQRPSQGWGTPAEVRDVAHATNKFLDALIAVPGWNTMALTAAAQTVQRSGFPLAYAKWETQAANLTAAAIGAPPIAPGGTGAPTPCTV